MRAQTRAAIYRRISTSGQEDGSSLDVQFDACAEYIRAKGYEYVADYSDTHSGADLWFRPQLQEMLNGAAEGKFDVLVVHHTDRLSRDADHVPFLRVQLKRDGVLVESVTNPRTDSFEDRLMATFEALFAQHERTRIQTRMASGRKERVRKGRLQPGGWPLFGYQYDNPEKGQKNRYVEDPAQSWVVRRIYREAVEGHSLRQISAGLRADGILTGRGKEWQPRQISRLLAHPTYRGVVAANRYTSMAGKAGKRSTSSRPESEWIPTPDGAPALVDDTTWFRANERLERNLRERTRDYDKATDALLRAGFVHCSWCGSPMSVHRQHGNTYYRCNRSNRDLGTACRGEGRGRNIDAGNLDGFVWARCESWLGDPGVLLHEAQRSRPAVAEALQEDLTRFDEGLRKIEAEQGRLAEHLGRLSEYAAAPILDRLNALGADRAGILAERQVAADRIEAAKSAERAVESVWTEILGYAETIQEWGYEEKRELLHRLGVRVTVEKRGVGKARVWVEANPPWPEDVEWWGGLFPHSKLPGPFDLDGDVLVGGPRRPFESGAHESAVTSVTTVFMGTVWSQSTLLARQMRHLRSLESADGRQRVWLVPWTTVARDLPAYGDRVRARIDQLGEGQPFIRTEYFLEELEGEGGLFPPHRLAQMRGDHPRLERARPGHRYALLIDVAGEEGTSSDAAGTGNAAGAGNRRDSTALTVVEVDTTSRSDGRAMYRVVDRRIWTGVRHTALHDQLVDLARSVWRASWVVVDATGIGAGLASFLRASLAKRRGVAPPVQVVPFIFSAASKSRLGWDFLGLIDAGRFKDYASDAGTTVHRPDATGHVTALYEAQLRATTYEVLQGPGNVLRWSVPSHAGHDDLVMSAALTAELERLDPRPRIALGRE